MKKECARAESKKAGVDTVGKMRHNQKSASARKEERMPNCDNTRPCPCTYPCPRHGKCCECVAYHRDKEGGVPGCFFTREGEATYDRSIEALYRDHKTRK